MEVLELNWYLFVFSLKLLIRSGDSFEFNTILKLENVALPKLLYNQHNSAIMKTCTFVSVCTHTKRVNISWHLIGIQRLIKVRLFTFEAVVDLGSSKK